jgi:hypothetical protein
MSRRGELPDRLHLHGWDNRPPGAASVQKPGTAVGVMYRVMGVPVAQYDVHSYGCQRISFDGEKMNYAGEITEDYGYGKIGIPQGGFARNFGNFKIIFVPFVPIVGKVGIAGGRFKRRFRRPDRAAQTDNPIIEQKFKSVKGHVGRIRENWNSRIMGLKRGGLWK